MYVRNITIVRGVGCSIGSVTPSSQGVLGSCIRNVTFDGITFDAPFKAVYIKSNPGDNGVGTVANIVYRNLNVVGSLWYPIWIGPQQEQQPHQQSKGCSFLFPLPGYNCTTNPRVSITNITIEDSQFALGVTLPGVFLCDPKNPCTGLTLRNVQNTGIWSIQDQYYCHNAAVQTIGSTFPKPNCSSKATEW